MPLVANYCTSAKITQHTMMRTLLVIYGQTYPLSLLLFPPGTISAPSSYPQHVHPIKWNIFCNIRLLGMHMKRKTNIPHIMNTVNRGSNMDILSDINYLLNRRYISDYCAAVCGIMIMVLSSHVAVAILRF